MCEYNRPYPVPFGQHPDDKLRSIITEPPLLPHDAWLRRAAQLPEGQAEIIAQAVEEADKLRADVHIYRRIGSPIIGLAFKPGAGPGVKIWEH